MMSEWISVNDRLPDFETDTLLVVVSTRHADEVFSDTDGFENGKFVYWGVNGDVTHWMELPKPPKTNEE